MTGMTVIIIILILMLGASVWLNFSGHFKLRKRKLSGNKPHDKGSDSSGTEVVEIFEPYKEYIDKTLDKQLSETVDRLQKQDKQIVNIEYSKYKAFYGWTQKASIHWRKK